MVKFLSATFVALMIGMTIGVMSAMVGRGIEIAGATHYWQVTSACAALTVAILMYRYRRGAVFDTRGLLLIAGLLLAGFLMAPLYVGIVIPMFEPSSIPDNANSQVAQMAETMKMIITHRYFVTGVSAMLILLAGATGSSSARSGHREN